MSKRYLPLVSLCVFFAVFFTLEGGPAKCRQDKYSRDSQSDSPKHSAEHDVASEETVKTAYGKLPLSFELNRGQTDAEVKFLSRGNGYTLFLTQTEAVLALRNPRRVKDAPEKSKAERVKVSANLLRMHLLGANRTPQIEGLDLLAGKSHHFIGSNPEQWRTNISHYARVRCLEIYPGIDLIYYGNEGRLEYDFVVSPGADPKAIRLGFKGVEKLGLDDEGNLILPTGGGEVIQHAPIVYQEVDGQRRSVLGGYLLKGDNEVAFQVAGYDRSRPLVIDPILSYSTYLGGSMSDRAVAIAVDGAGAAYVTGWTFSTDFPEEGPSLERGAEEDVFVAKLNRFGTELIYSTFLGGDDYDHAQGIALDSQGNAYITGFTKSTDFPAKQPFQSTNRGKDDAFVAKLSADGSSLIYSTYLGGREGDRGAAIAVDAAGRAYVTGYTLSDEFPIAPLVCAPRLDCPYQNARRDRADVFVTKFHAQGDDLVYSTYLGGNDQDTADAIALDGSGRAIVAGTTLSTDFPTENPIQASSAGGVDDGFVAKLDSKGHALIFSTYLGGSDRDSIQGLAIDSSTNIYVAGTTSSDDFPTTTGAFNERYNGGDSDVFVARLRFSGTDLQYSTYLGGEALEAARGLAVTAAGNACVTGYTESTGFPTPNAIQADKAPPLTGMDGRDAFVTKLNREGSGLLYSTYLGGEGMDYAQGIAMDDFDNVYVTGLANSADFPTAPPRPCIPSRCPFQATFAGGGDIFISRIDDFPAEPLEITECSATGDSDMTLTWTSEEGRTYSVLQQYDLALSSWYTRTTIVATGETTTWTQKDARTVPESFYRVVRTE